MSLKEVLQPRGKPQDSGSGGNLRHQLHSAAGYPSMASHCPWDEVKMLTTTYAASIWPTFSFVFRNPVQPLCCCRACTNAVCLSEVLLYLIPPPTLPHQLLLILQSQLKQLSSRSLPDSSNLVLSFHSTVYFPLFKMQHLGSIFLMLV